MSLVFDEKTSVNVETKQDTKLFVLLKNAFMQIINENLELKKQLNLLMKNRDLKAKK
ncbi:MAG: hypothetical protein ABDH23_02715 [Endomicrobiia bacterium]